MRETFGDSVKFGRDPFTEWLYGESLNGGCETAGDVQFGEHVCLMGRNLLREDSQGFVYRDRYDNRDAAREAFDAFAAEYDDDQEDDDDTMRGECCVDCLVWIANGDTSGIDDEEREREVMAGGAVPIGYHAVPDCVEGCEGSFSMSSCDVCGSRLGGERHRVAFLPNPTPGGLLDEVRQAERELGTI